MTDSDDDPKREAAHTERDGNLEHHYDSNWNLIGHTERDGDREHHYDPSWNTTGRTERDGDREHHYDPSWNTTGHTERDGELEHHYDPSWNSTGHTERDGNLEHHYDSSWRRVEPSGSVRGGTASGAAAWGGSGGAGGEVLGKTVLIAFLVIAFVIISIPLGLFLKWKEKRDAVAAIGTLRMNISVRSKDIDESGAIRYAHGQPQSLDIEVNWEGPLYNSQRPLHLTVFRNRVIYYDRLWTHQDLSLLDRFACAITNTFPIGRYVVQASVEGASPAEYRFTVEPRPPGNVSVSDTPPGWPAQHITTLQLRPGDKKKIYVYVGVNGTIPTEGRIVYISLAHEGTPLFNYSNQVKEENRNFNILYEADFSEGVYTARLSADGEPPAEYAFKVQYPVVESYEDKNQRTREYLDAVLPGSPQSIETRTPSTTAPPAQKLNPLFADCYSGTWHESESNGFIWYFRRLGNNLRISRNDGNAGGQFQESADGWIGFMTWGNGARLDGVVLHKANEACDEITTNQRWSYKR